MFGAITAVCVGGGGRVAALGLAVAPFCGMSNIRRIVGVRGAVNLQVVSTQTIPRRLATTHSSTLSGQVSL